MEMGRIKKNTVTRLRHDPVSRVAHHVLMCEYVCVCGARGRRRERLEREKDVGPPTRRGPC